MVPADPPVIVQLMPAGVERTAPFPPAPPATVNRKLLAGVLKTADTVTSAVIGTWHEVGSSEVAVQPTHAEKTLPGEGTACSVTTAFALYCALQVPLVEATPFATEMLQEMPPRLDVTVPATVLPVPLTVKRGRFAPREASSAASGEVGSVGLS
jgi:hypothetical protein